MLPARVARSVHAATGGSGGNSVRYRPNWRCSFALSVRAPTCVASQPPAITSAPRTLHTGPVAAGGWTFPSVRTLRAEWLCPKLV
eukprot:4659155-Pyramimonas_sp.AAC.1